jgi:hypothetical protein
VQRKQFWGPKLTVQELSQDLENPFRIDMHEAYNLHFSLLGIQKRMKRGFDHVSFHIYNGGAIFSILCLCLVASNYTMQCETHMQEKFYFSYCCGIC